MKALDRTRPRVPARWSYASSVRRMKATVWKWKRLTGAMLHELWIAHEVLTKPGARTDLAANATKSWDTYCEDIGLNRVTAWRWLKQYDPQQRKLIETEPDAKPSTPAVAEQPESLLVNAQPWPILVNAMRGRRRVLRGTVSIQLSGKAAEVLRDVIQPLANETRKFIPHGAHRDEHDRLTAEIVAAIDESVRVDPVANETRSPAPVQEKSVVEVQVVPEDLEQQLLQEISPRVQRMGLRDRLRLAASIVLRR